MARQVLLCSRLICLFAKHIVAAGMEKSWPGRQRGNGAKALERVGGCELWFGQRGENSGF